MKLSMQYCQVGYTYGAVVSGEPGRTLDTSLRAVPMDNTSRFIVAIWAGNSS